MTALKLDPFNGMKPKKPELVVESKQNNGLIKQVMDDYESIWKNHSLGNGIKGAFHDISRIGSIRLGLALDPTELELFWLMLQEEETSDARLHSLDTTLFLTGLIQNSYNAGNNGFYLDLVGPDSDYSSMLAFGYMLTGRPGNLMRIVINQDKISNLFEKSRHVEAEILGPAMNFLGESAQDCVFKVNEVEHIGYLIEDCVFKTSREPTYSEIGGMLREHTESSGNRIVLLDAEDNVKEELKIR